MNAINNALQVVSDTAQSVVDHFKSNTNVMAAPLNAIGFAFQGNQNVISQNEAHIDALDNVVAMIYSEYEHDPMAGLTESEISQYNYINNFSSSAASDYKRTQLKEHLADNYIDVSSNNPVKQTQFECFEQLMKASDPVYMNSLNTFEKRQFAEKIMDIAPNLYAAEDISNADNIIIGYNTMDNLLTDNERTALEYNTYKAFKEWCDKANPSLEARDAFVNDYFEDASKFETMLAIENSNLSHSESTYNSPVNSLYTASLLSVIECAKTADKDIHAEMGIMWRDEMTQGVTRVFGVDSNTVGLTDSQKAFYNKMPSSDAEKYRETCLQQNYDGDYLKGAVAANEFEKTCFENLEGFVKKIDVGYLDTLSDSGLAYLMASTNPLGHISFDDTILWVGGIEALDDDITSVEGFEAYKNATLDATTKWVKANMNDLDRLPDEMVDSFFREIDMESIRKEYEASKSEVQTTTKSFAEMMQQAGAEMTTQHNDIEVDVPDASEVTSNLDRVAAAMSVVDNSIDSTDLDFNR
ncbi:hypothetical protein J6A31_04830 [bacterium]|nr:hypothetical protein [bacterium]